MVIAESLRHLSISTALNATARKLLIHLGSLEIEEKRGRWYYKALRLTNSPITVKSSVENHVCVQEPRLESHHNTVPMPPV